MAGDGATPRVPGAELVPAPAGGNGKSLAGPPGAQPIPRLLRIVPGPSFSVVKHRKVWLGNGRAHIEIRGGRHPDAKALLKDVEEKVATISGVRWVKTIAMLGQLVVAFEGEGADLGELFDSVDSLEAVHEVEDDGNEVVHREHPADSSPIRRNLLLLGADAVGLALSPFSWLIDTIPFIAEAASLVTVAESSERVRRFVDRTAGEAGIFGLAAIGAVAQGLTQGPLGIVVDTAHRMATLAEVHARNNAWSRREPELTERTHELPDVDHSHAKPTGHHGVERFADIAVVSSLAGSVGAGIVTRSPTRAAGVMLAGIPKAALRGHEAFASEMARRMANRGAIIMDYSLFRVLDRVDTVVIEQPSLLREADVAAVTALVDAAHGAGLRAVMAMKGRKRPSLSLNGPSLELDEWVPGGVSLATSIKSLQAEGRIVLLVSFGHHNVFRAAHASIGILHSDHHVPWGADVIVGPGYEEAVAMVAAAGAARRASRVGIGLSMAASAVGNFAAMTAPLPVSVPMSVLPVNVAALVSMGWAAMAATITERKVRGASMKPPNP